MTEKINIGDLAIYGYRVYVYIGETQCGNFMRRDLYLFAEANNGMCDATHFDYINVENVEWIEIVKKSI